MLKHLKIYQRFVRLLSLSVLLLFTAGCYQLCLRPTLPTEPHPIMLEVVSDENGGLDEENTKAMMSNLYIYQGALDRCNETIRIYNLSVK